MRILVACEFMGHVRDAFLARGHAAISCDLEPTTVPGPHIVGDVRNYLHEGWDMLIGFPPCTYMCNSGLEWFTRVSKNPKVVTGPMRWTKLAEAVELFLALWNAPIEKIALENPIMHPHAKSMIGVQQSQVIQPWQFGHHEQKATCLWLKNLPLLEPTDIVPVYHRDRSHNEPKSKDRWKKRSETFSGFALAMAQQWG